MSDKNFLSSSFLLDGHEGPLAVHAVRGREEVSRPYRFEVDFSGQDVDVDSAPGARVLLRLESPQVGERFVGGVVEELEVAAMAQRVVDSHARYRAFIVPEPYLVLSNRHGFRIFQQKTTRQIVEQVCQDAGLDKELFDWRGVTGSYPKRDYCVQYDETEWDFVCRLLEDEGICFAFSHMADGARMLFEDDSSSVDLLSTEELEFTFAPRSDAPVPQVWDFHVETRLRPSKATVNDYDMTRPSTSLLASAEAREAVSREWYEYPGGFRANAEGKRRAQVRLEEQRSSRVVARGRTDALFMEPGRRFQLVEHPAASAEYFVTAVSFYLRFDEETAADRPLVDAGPWLFQMDFEAVPSEQLFRPARLTPRPRVVGPQTARVTGPSGEEIHCDAHGRVKLQFPWDREGQYDERTSCWVRVTQAHTTGALMIPRVGWEVLVEFEDGDPDRPVCLGKVWNAFFPPPVELPGGKTQTGHSSISSPGGGGVNEVIFDDTAGAESVTIQGQYDISVKAANNKLLNVGHDLSHVVNGKREGSVGGNEQVAVSSNQDVNVGGANDTSVGAMRDVKVTGSATEEVAGGFTLQVGGMEMIQVGSPVQAVLDTIKEAAVQAAEGMAAQALGAAQQALLGPILPVLAGARAALGEAAQFAGPAAALLKGGDPKIAALAEAAGTLSNVEGAREAGQIAAGVARLAAGSGMASPAGGGSGGGGGASGSWDDGGSADAGGGGGGGGGDAAPEGPAGATAGGSGIWHTVVNGSVKESVGGLAAINSLKGISFAVGGTATETVGAARVELIGGGKAETTGGSKLETVGVYMVNAKESLAIDAKAAVAVNIAGTQKQRISGGHSISADGPVLVSASQLKLKGKGTITLTCGSTKVVVKSGGIFVEGGAALTIEGSSIELDENALGT
ncbi:type VI secretion system Vgr family protein [Hyalangium versicolor]|uniref:type VI secretion system Vgr family protein n=1 Tax=Hyalangium versicolor TaxID=2861190 RepID=UPI001CD01CA2|nr:type VI secretion system tip protein TssI/VgrG [Hyalangium versicolor]